MDVITFYELYIFDTYLEPQSPVLNDFYHARLTQTIIASNPNLTKEGRKSLNMKDFYMMKDRVFKSEEELEKEAEQKEAKQKEAIEAMFDPELLAKAKKIKAKQKGA